MKPNRIFKMSMSLVIMTLAIFMSGCMDKDNFQPPTPEPLPPASEYPDFSLRGDVKLSVNYNVPGFKAFIEVYDEYPLELKGASYVKKEGLNSKYAVFTDDQSKFEGIIHIPVAIKKAYLYTAQWGLPMCVEMETTADGFVYDATKENAKAAKASRASRASGNWLSGDQIPFKVSGPYGGARGDNMYSICDWDERAVILPAYITQTENRNKLLKDVADRTQTWLTNYLAPRHEIQPKSSEDINITTTKETEIEVTYLATGGSLSCVFGYYYYPKNSAPASVADLYAIRKYVVIPSNQRIREAKGNTIKLKFFGDNGTEAATDKFPGGYSIGWFVISENAPETNWKYIGPGMVENSEYFNPQRRRICFSNDEPDLMNFISMYDKNTGTIVIGAEDVFGGVNLGTPDNDFDDLMFFVTTDKNVETGNRPEVPSESKPETGVNHVEGILCFEDNWPDAGDYDMNDVAVQYTRAITIDGNNVPTDIRETFEFVQKDNAANYDNFFAYQVDPATSGEIVDKLVDLIDAGNTIIWEEATNSFVINISAKQANKQASGGRKTMYEVQRKVHNVDLSQLTGSNSSKYFNPYIIIGSYATANRKEVHLPKYSATSAANQSLIGTGDDAYYVNRDGKYPFAIEIPKLTFDLPDERVRIDDESQYPLFEKWAGNNNQYGNWYIYPKGTTE